MTDTNETQNAGPGGSADQTGGGIAGETSDSAVGATVGTTAGTNTTQTMEKQTTTADSGVTAADAESDSTPNINEADAGETSDSDAATGDAATSGNTSEAGGSSESTSSDVTDDNAEEIMEEGASRSNSYLSGLKGVTIPNTTPFYSEKIQRGRHFSDKKAIRADDPNLDDSMKKIFAMLDDNASAYYEKQDAQKPKLFPEPSYEAKPEETLPSDSSLAELAQHSAQINSRDDVQIEASLGLKPGDLENFDDFDDFDDERKKTYATLTGTLQPISAPLSQDVQSAGNLSGAETAAQVDAADAAQTGTEQAQQQAQPAEQGAYAQQTAQDQPVTQARKTAQAQSFAQPQQTAQSANTAVSPTTNESHTMNEQQTATQNPSQNQTAEQMQAMQAQYLAQQQAAQAQAQQQYAAYQQAMLQQMQAQRMRQAQAAQTAQQQSSQSAQAARTAVLQAQGGVSYQQVNLQAPTFVVPPSDDSGKDNAVLKKRREKAQLVAQTMFREHPDADTEFINAVYRLVELNASDLHLVVGDKPMLRVDGRLTPVPESQVWDKERTLAAVQVMTTDEELQRFEQELELDVSFAIGDLVRFRVNVYQDRNGVCAALRTIPLEIKTVNQLGLDQRIADLALLPRGLVLVCGPTGSGKSTTLAAIVDKANAERHDHIITIEDPIEFVHRHKNCVVSQREVGTDTLSFAEALKHALREDPDIIMVGELRDLETISTALTAVETGHLVFATLHTQDAGSTVDRLIDVYPENQQQQIRVQVASTLRAVIVQTLLPKASGHGRVPATEVMYATPAISALIREGKTHQVRTQLQSGGDLGMHTLDQDLARLVNRGDVQLDVAEQRCQDRKEFEKLVQSRVAY
ncbi:type IV pilus twitching motility protein PilT [Bifidobacterium thermacidophilum]|nr:PilT/PilU family type 4a pilus ATPase [Bifidobacterium thermacidophilum]